MTIKNIWLILFLTGCGGARTGFFPVQAGEHSNSQADAVLSQFTTSSYRGQYLDWVLQAKSAWIEQFKELTMVNNLEIQYYEKNQPTTLLKGDSGIFDSKKGTFEVNGNVSAESPNGRKLVTDKLTWYGKSRILATPSRVVITTAEGDKITGQGLHADQMLNKIELYHGKGYHPPE